MSAPPSQSNRLSLSAVGGYDGDIYSAVDEPSLTSIAAASDIDEAGLPPSSAGPLAHLKRPLPSSTTTSSSSSLLPDAEPDDVDVFAAYRHSRVSDRDNEYRAKRLQRVLEPTRMDAFDTSSGKTTGGVGYRDVMMERRLAQEEAAVLREIEKRRREEVERKRQVEEEQRREEEERKESKDDGFTQPSKKRRRWDDGAETESKQPPPPPRPATSIAEDEDNEPLDWDTTSLLKPKPPKADDATDDDGTVSVSAAAAAAAVAAAKQRKVSRWDATPSVAQAREAQRDATPLISVADTPSRKKSRWDETPLIVPGAAATPLHPSATPSLTSMTPTQLTLYRMQADIEARNRPLSDAELDALLPGADDGFEILQPPESYKPLRTPSRKLMLTPAVGGERDSGFFIAEGAASDALLEQLPALPADSGLPGFANKEDEQYFAKLVEEVDETELTAAEAKERRILKLLLKIKNGSPPQRKSALRAITDRARELGAGPLFDAILPLLMSPTLEDQERHVLVKVIDRVLYKLDELVRPYVHKILVVIEPLLIDEDYFARVEGREIVSNLAKAAGLATMIATMRPDIDSTDEYVRNTTARAFAVVASALGIGALLPFLQAVCQSKRSWEARHTGIKIVQQIAILMGVAILPHLTALVTCVQHGLADEQTKVKCITALALAALAEASHPYGVDSFDTVLKPLWLGVKAQRGKTLAAFLKAIGYIIPLMDESYASFYTKEVMVILIREFNTADEEMKKIVLKVLKQCVSTPGIDMAYVNTVIIPDFFRAFWTRRMALDRRNYRELVDTTVELSVKVGAMPILSRLLADLKDESEVYRRMVLETIERVMAGQGVSEMDQRTEEQLMDGLLYAFQEQQSEDVAAGNSVMNSFGIIVNVLGQRCKPYLPQVAGIIKWSSNTTHSTHAPHTHTALAVLGTLPHCSAVRTQLTSLRTDDLSSPLPFVSVVRRLNNKTARVRQQAADLIARVAPVMQLCSESALLSHLGLVLYEYLGEEYPDVLGSIISALKSVVMTVGVDAMQPSIKDLLPRLTPILKNRHEKVQEATIDLVGRLADKGADQIHAKELMRISFELLELLKAPRKSIRRASVSTFGYIAKAIGPHDVMSVLLNNLRVQERQMRVCTCVAIAIVAEQCSPFTVLPALMNEYSVPECVYVDTRILMADGTDKPARQLQNGDALLNELGQPVFVVNLVGADVPVGGGVWMAPVGGALLTAPLYSVTDVEAAGAGAETGQGAFFDPFLVTANHQLTVGSSCPASPENNHGRWYAKAWQHVGDWGHRAAYAEIGQRSITVAGPLVPGAPNAGAQCGSRAGAQARCATWNAHFNLPRTARLWEIRADAFDTLGPDGRVRSKLQKIREPISFAHNGGEIASEQWLAAAIDTALANARLHGHASLPAGYPVLVGGEFDDLVERLRVQAVGFPVVAGKHVPLPGTIAFSGDLYHSPATAPVPALPPGGVWPAAFLRLFPVGSLAHVASAAGAPFPGYKPTPAGGVETHERDFCLSAAAPPVVQRREIRQWIFRVTAWVLGVWIADGDGRDGLYIVQSPFTQKGSSRGVHRRMQRWCAMLGLPGFYRVEQVVPTQMVAGGEYHLPSQRLHMHPMGVRHASLLRSVLVALGLYVVPVVPWGAAAPVGYAAAMKQRWSAEPQRGRLVRLPFRVRWMLLTGLVDAGGWRVRTCDCYAFFSEFRAACDLVVFLARVSGLSAFAPIRSQAGWSVQSILANYDRQAEAFDCAVVGDRVPVPAGVGAQYREQDPYAGAMKVTAPAVGAVPQRYVQFQVAAAPGGAGLPLHQGRFLLASGAITHNCNVQNGVLKALSFVFEYIGAMGKDYVYATVSVLTDALMDRDAVHRQTACSVVKHMALGCVGMGREDAFVHLLNYVWPNVFELSPHVIGAVLEAVEAVRCAIGSARLLQYLEAGLYHPARKVRQVYWRIYNSMYVAAAESLVPAYPNLPNDANNDYTRHELQVFL